MSDNNENNLSEADLKKDFKKGSEVKKPLYSGKIAAVNSKVKKLKGSKTFVFTSAQNNTPVHKGLLKSLQAYCEDKDAQLFVSRFSYNQNGFQNGVKNDIENGKGAVWYDPAIEPYVLDELVKITKDIYFGGNINILPTADKPLSRWDNYFREASGIVPHVKHALQSHPTLIGEARFLYSTGALTKRNYIQKKTGQIAEFHHNYGALVVEIDEDGDFFARQLAANDDGSFQDLTDVYNADGTILRNQPVEAITWGDIHVEMPDEEVYKSSFFAEDSMLKVLNPKYQFIHDLVCFNKRNHHNRDNWVHNLRNEAIRMTVDKEHQMAADFLKVIEKDGVKTIVVKSNHDEAFEKWLIEGKEKEENGMDVLTYHRSKAEMAKNILEGNKDFDVFEWAIRQKAPNLKHTTFLKVQDTFRVCAKRNGSGGVECGQHGHIGNNGAKGSSSSYEVLGIKVNRGHDHTASINHGVYTAGITGDFNQEYNAGGGSSWSHSHIVTYPNGKRAIITLKKNKRGKAKWRADREDVPAYKLSDDMKP